MAGYVYLIGSSTFKWYKIGKSSRPVIRMTELGILLPFRIEVIAVWKLSNYNAVEHDLHEKHAANRINGEWFSFNAEEVKAIVADMSYASTDAAIGFANIEQDYAPEGKIVKFAFRKPPQPRKPPKDRTPEEIEFINWQRLAWSEWKRLEDKEEQKKRKREIIDETLRRKAILKAKLLDTKTGSE